MLFAQHICNVIGRDRKQASISCQIKTDFVEPIGTHSIQQIVMTFHLFDVKLIIFEFKTKVGVPVETDIFHFSETPVFVLFLKIVKMGGNDIFLSFLAVRLCP